MEERRYDGFTRIESRQGISQYRLDANGLDVLLVPMTLAPVVTFMITYRVGSRNESTGETGATHFLEHLMFKGTERFNRESGNSIFNTLQRVGARVNATTWLDRTNYYELLPDDKLEQAIEIEADRMRGAKLDPEDVDRERTVILNELDRGENEPMRKLYQTVWSTAFLAHPYRHPTIGWRSDVENLSPNQLRNFYDTFYWPDNATVSVIGSFDDERTMRLVSEYFGDIPAAPNPAPKIHTVEPRQVGTRHVTVRMAGEPGAVMVAFKAPPASDVLSAALSVLSVVLGDGKAGRLYTGLVDSGRAIGVSAVNSLLRDPGLFYVYAMLAPGITHADVEEKLVEELDRLTSSPIEETELNRAKAIVRADTSFDRDGPFSIASSLNEAIASGDWKLYLSIPEAIAAVTTDDLLQAAKSIFEPDSRTVGYFVPR